MNSYRFHEQSRPLDFDYGLFRPLLRASLEQGAKQPVETCNESVFLFAGAFHEFEEFVNYAG
jgi:hypothetical protein